MSTQWFPLCSVYSVCLATCTLLCKCARVHVGLYGAQWVRQSMRGYAREAVTFFSVCIPGNCSAALLNNESSAYTVCVFMGVSAGRT